MKSVRFKLAAVMIVLTIFSVIVVTFMSFLIAHESLSQNAVRERANLLLMAAQVVSGELRTNEIDGLQQTLDTLAQTRSIEYISLQTADERIYVAGVADVGQRLERVLFDPDNIDRRLGVLRVDFAVDTVFARFDNWLVQNNTLIFFVVILVVGGGLYLGLEWFVISPLANLSATVSRAIGLRRWPTSPAATEDEFGRLHNKINTLGVLLDQKVERLQLSNQRYRGIYVDAPAMLILADRNHVILLTNQRFAAAVGYRCEQLRGRDVFSLLNGDLDLSLPSSSAGPVRNFGKNERLDLLMANGDRMPVAADLIWQSKQAWPSPVAVISLRDLTPLQAAESLARRESTIDSVTGFGNRRSAQLRLAESMKEPGKMAAVFLVGVDRLTWIMDAFGDLIAAKVLAAFANRFREVAAIQGLHIYRGGADTFVAISDAGDDLAHLHAMAEELAQYLQRPDLIDELQISISVSIGVARYDDPCIGASDLLNRADLAMRSCKQNPSVSVALFHERLLDGVERFALLDKLLNKAISGGDFGVNLEPICSLETNKVLGYAANIRLFSLGGLALNSTEILRIANQTGAIVALTRLVIDRVLDRWERLQVELGGSQSLSIRLSAASLHDPLLLSALEKHASGGYEPNKIMLSLSEEQVLSLSPAAIEAVHDLQEMGYKIGLDSFGEHQMSLRTLREIDFDYLYLAAEMITDLHQFKSKQRTLAVAVNLCLELGIIVVATQVENAFQAKILSAIGVEAIQGVFARDAFRSNVLGSAKSLSRLTLVEPHRQRD